MGTLELYLLSLGVAMDAFAASVCKGLAARRISPGRMITCGLWFGAFQALMPLLGYLLGVRFQAAIAQIDHWIAFVLLGCIGLNMLREALGGDVAALGGDVAALDADFGVKSMLPLAVATSIDALALGVTFACLDVDIAPACLVIGGVTFLASALGAALGGVFGARWKNRAEAAGGIILILIGLKILIEHLIRG